MGTARWLRSVAMMVFAAWLAACTQSAAPLAHDAYIWQRQWTPALREAVASSSDLVGDWRVLVAQADREGRLLVFEPDRDALARSGRPVVLVVRIDGRLARLDPASLVERIAGIARGWPVPSLAGIEIDYDCPTARLPAYASFLATLKARLGTLPLSITALPTWIGSPDLDGLLATVDSSVLQVHAVQAPQAGLFDPTVASHWVEDYATHTTRPFRVALPTYGSRVSWNADGSLLAVESEHAALAAGAVSSELHATPATVMAFVANLKRRHPRQLVGVAWFRLPTADDTRAWSLATWRGVVEGHMAVAPVEVGLSASADTNAPADVFIANDSEVDADAPGLVTLPAGCDAADGIDGYVLRQSGRTLTLVGEKARPLPAHTRRAIGWARCKPGTSPVTLSPLPHQGTPVS